MYRTNLGVLPLAVGIVGAGAALEAAWAWYEPNSYGTPFWEKDQEQRVATINNAFHNLERTARSVGVPISDPAMGQLYGDMNVWWTWHEEYKNAVLQRYIPFASDRDWDAEINLWLKKFQEDNNAIAKVAGDAYRKALAQKMDPRFLEPQQTITEKATDLIKETTQTVSEAPKHALFWPAMGALGLGIALVWIGSKAATPRRVTR